MHSFKKGKQWNTNIRSSIKATVQQSNFSKKIFYILFFQFSMSNEAVEHAIDEYND